MLWNYRRRTAIGAALALNALRPIPGPWPAVPSFFAGWLTAELAPQLLALVAGDTAAHVVRGRRRDGVDGLALAVAGLSAAGLAVLARQGGRAHLVVDMALAEGMGAAEAARFGLAERTKYDDTLRQLLLPFRMHRPDVERIRDVPYADGGWRQCLDVYRSKDRPTGSPVLLQVHGGGWTIGNKNQQGLPLMHYLAARGWVCVSANYRLSPKARFPDHLIDLKRALAWIREHAAEYGGDPSFVAVTGGSAGGHLAALLALTANDPEYQPGFENVDTRVQACVPHYGLYDFVGESGTTMARRRTTTFLAPVVMKRDPVSERSEFEKASPLSRVRSDAPPFFVVHGHHDTLIPVAEARLFVDRLRAVSRAPVVYAELPGTQHAFDLFPSPRSIHVVRAVERFLRAARSGTCSNHASARC